MRRNMIRTISLLMALCVSVGMVGITAWATGAARGAAPVSKYEKPDTNELTSLGLEPEEISVSSKDKYFGKAWYEYIAYNDLAVSSIRISNDERIIFYDPIDYGNSMVMDVTYDDKVGWSTANSVTIEHSFSTTLSHDTSYSTETSTDLEHADGMDITNEVSSSVSTSASQATHQEYSTSAELSASKTIQEAVNVSEDITLETSASTTASTSVEVTLEETIKLGTDLAGSETTFGEGTHVGTEVTAGTSMSSTTGISTGVSTEESSSVTTSTSEAVAIEQAINSETADSETMGWSLVADRITTSKGSSASTTTGWSNTETLTIARTFEALYFTDSGTPYSWTIAYYEVKMPMKAALQYKIGGKWVTIDTGFVLLTTIQGSCRAWNINGAIHYEHWGTSEPVVDTDFWSGFFTEEALVEAYNRDGMKDVLYPN